MNKIVCFFFRKQTIANEAWCVKLQFNPKARPKVKNPVPKGQTFKFQINQQLGMQIQVGFVRSVINKTNGILRYCETND